MSELCLFVGVYSLFQSTRVELPQQGNLASWLAYELQLRCMGEPLSVCLSEHLTYLVVAPRL
jgi:hypothetical protein